MFLHMCVILITGGVCFSACWDTPPGKADPHPPWQGDPHCAVHAGRYGQQVGGMHPTGMQFLFTPVINHDKRRGRT